MSDKASARRTEVQVVIGGTDITNDIRPYLLSLDYIDNEEDETDDLQIKLQDRDGIWRQKWLNDAVMISAGLQPARVLEHGTDYTVTAAGGVILRAGPGTGYARLGSYAYGQQVSVLTISGGWAKTKFSGKDAYVEAGSLKLTTAPASTAPISVGDEVIANGQPQFSSYGQGSPGAAVTNYKGKVTYLNRQNGVPYPICVGYLGWFAESQVQRVGAETTAVQQTQEASAGVSNGKLSIQAVIVRQNWNGDGKDKILDCGQFELDSVTAQGPPSIVTIKGTALPFTSSVRQTLKSKSWENYTLKGIAEEIAGKNGMACVFSGGVNPSYKRVEQYRQSDISFLQKLCGDCGCSLKCYNNIIVVFNQAQYESKNAVFEIEHGKGGYSKYSLKTGKDNTYTSCRVSWTTTSGSCISGTAYVENYKEGNEKNQQLEIRQRVSSVAEATKLAEAHLKLHNKYELTSQFTVPGNPDLMSGRTGTLKGFGLWDGKQIIKQAKHSVSGSGYQTTITLRKV